MNKEKEPLTFTKLSMILIYSLYFLGAIIGAVLTIWAASVDISLGLPINESMFIAYATYLAAPTTIAISFYAWKAKSENILKIYYGNQDVEDPHKPAATLSELIESLGRFMQ